MSEYECLVPELEWNLSVRHRQQEQGRVVEEDRNRNLNLNLNQNQQKDHANNSNSMSSHSHVQQRCSVSCFHQNNHHHHHSSASIPIPADNVEELTWENGQLAMHGHRGSVLPMATPKPVWASSDTLESVVRQASTSSLQHNQYHVSNIAMNDVMNPTNINNGFSPVDQKPDKIVGKNSGRTRSENMMVPVMKKRTRSETGQCGTTSISNFTSTSNSGYGDNNEQEERKIKIMDRSMCASASVPFGREDWDTTMMTWPSFDSSRSFKTNMTTDDDSVASPGGSENQDDDQETKTETGRSLSSRRRAAAVHNQSERRRRDRINQKMKTLQRLLPNSHKTDKASMLDEAIEYLKQLQAQVQMMSTMRNINSMPHMMMMPIGMSPQQQLQMSLLSRMSAGGVGIGLGTGMAGIGTAGVGMLDINSMARSPAHQPPGLSPLLHHPTPSQFAVPTTHPTASSAQTGPTDAGKSGSLHLPDPYCAALIAQRMNDIEIYSKMAALYSQQAMASPSTKANEAKRE